MSFSHEVRRRRRERRGRRRKGFGVYSLKFIV
jgi:hypothetical protein